MKYKRNLYQIKKSKEDIDIILKNSNKNRRKLAQEVELNYTMVSSILSGLRPCTTPIAFILTKKINNNYEIKDLFYKIGE